MITRLTMLAAINVIAAADLVTDAWALALPASGLTILPFLNLRLSFNTGIAFGMLAADGVHGYVVLVALTLAIGMFVLWLAWEASTALERVAYVAIVGGAFGNLLDRLPDGMVTDFLDFHASGWHFPTFNLGDVAISAGVVLLVAQRIRASRSVSS